MYARFLTTIGMATAAVALTAAGATAATPHATAPPVAGTTQTLSITIAGGGTNSDSIVFKSSSWKLKMFQDKGTFTNHGSSLVLKTTSKADKGCTYTGTYKAAKDAYAGTFSCPNGGPTGTFTVSTDG